MADSRETALIVFLPAGKRGLFPSGTTVLQAARQLGVDVDSVCGGRAICGRCQIVLAEGEFAKHGIRSRADHLSAVGAAERAYSERHPIAGGRRLSCQALIEGDVVIDVPADSQVHKQLVRKSFEAREIQLDPPIHLYLVDVPQPVIEDPKGDLERVLLALEREWQLTGIWADLSVIQRLRNERRTGQWQATVAIREGTELVGVWPGFKERVYGIALDLGSTTIAAHLCDFTTGEVRASAGTMNPQIRFGEDLMSRVSFAIQNDGGAKMMTDAVRGAINSLIAQVVRDAHIAVTDVLEIALVGNPVMHHLALGLDPRPLGVAPFTLATNTAQNVRSSDLDLAIHPAGRLYALPCIAGHIGADSAAVILAEGLGEGERTSLVIDVGTNAEILLARGNRLLAASSPTGPAFEGAQISCGQRAAPGAIEHVRIDAKTLEPRFKVIGCDLWSHEPNFAAATRGTGVTGICGSGIIEAIAEMFLSGIITSDGVIDSQTAARSPRIGADGRTYSYLLYESGPGLRIKQNDVRAIQLAKAALYAGTQILMEYLGVDTIDRIRLAGAFGSYIDVKYAMVLGMIPDCDLRQVSAAGNAAGTGARLALLNRGARRKIEARVRRVEKIETAVAPTFQRHFVDAMTIPHRTHPFTYLASVVNLPERKRITAQSRRSRTRYLAPQTG
jgi:uncharacterized 2Fe-2S/4Fe-4S cluster protein (DUF4445 family)